MGHRQRILFFGTPDWTVDCLDILAENAGIVGIVSGADRPAGRGRHLHRPAPALWAESRGIPVFQPARLDGPELQEALARLEPTLGVIVAYGHLIPRSVFALPAAGSLNLHYSLLPAFRGASPIESALLTGASQSGVSLQRITEELDAGDILAARAVPVEATDHFPELFTRLHAAGLGLLAEGLALLDAGRAVFTPQDPAGVTRCGKIDNRERRIDWNDGAARVLNRIRAFSGRRTAWTRFAGHELLIHRAAPAAGRGRPGEVLRASGGRLEVACGDSALALLEVQPAGKRPLPVAAYLNGTRIPTGYLLGTENAAQGEHACASNS